MIVALWGTGTTPALTSVNARLWMRMYDTAPELADGPNMVADTPNDP